MHLYNKEQAIKRMNQFGQHHRPFVFIINYLQDASYIEEVAAVDSTELLYNLNGFTNQATSTEKYTPSFSAKPANSIHWQPSAESFYSYQRSFNIVRQNILAGNSFLTNLTCRTPVAKMKERPSFQLMVQTDVQSIYHMQMPRWLFSDPRYCEMSLDAKVTYTFLLNRFQLSRRNGWVNERGEVFVIFPRKALAKELRICEQRVTAAFKKLVELELVWEKRCGRGDANQIYLAYVTPQDDPNYTSAPFTAPEKSGGSRTSDSEPLESAEKSAPLQDPQDLHFKNRGFCGFRTAESAAAEAQKVMPSKKEKRKIDRSQIEVSPSVLKPTHDGLTDEEREDDFQSILDACELTGFTPGTALVFENAIERLYYSDSYRIGNATLPQSRVRAKLRRLDGMILREAERKLHENQEQNVKNSTAYTMAVLFNCIAESESDLLVDPYLNALSSTA